ASTGGGGSDWLWVECGAICRGSPPEPVRSRRCRMAVHAGDVRIGHGYDLHRLEAHPPSGAGKELVIGGVRLESARGPVAHSDGDVLYHALVDALMGALGLPDIGQMFPDD